MPAASVEHQPQPVVPPSPSGDDPQAHRVRRALLVYRVSLYYTLGLVAAWLLVIATGLDGGVLVRSPISIQQVVGTVVFLVMFWAVWSYAWYFLKRWQLRRAGFTGEELDAVFGNRLEGFDLAALLGRHSARRIRIIDMVARRGRTILPVVASFSYVYLATLQSQDAEGLRAGLQANVLDSIAMNTLGLIAFRSNGVFGHMMYGAQARVLDGVQGRANALCIGTLWSAFRFVMIPLGGLLATLYPPNRYAVLFAFIWFTYAAADFASEIVGSLWGRHTIRVWGLGDLNRKSWQGVVAGFVCSLALLLVIAWSQQLPAGWYALALVLAVANPIVELVSPRGSDDFTMATVNALICVAFGWIVF
jgi:hypothetical protein